MRIIKTHKSKKDLAHKVYKLHQLDWLEYVAIGLSLWFVFYPRPYEYLLIALLLLPFIGMFLNGLNKPSIASLIEINRNVKEEYNVADFIDLPAWLIVVRSYFVKAKPWAIAMMQRALVCHKRSEKY